MREIIDLIEGNWSQGRTVSFAQLAPTLIFLLLSHGWIFPCGGLWGGQDKKRTRDNTRTHNRSIRSIRVINCYRKDGKATPRGEVQRVRGGPDGYLTGATWVLWDSLLQVIYLLHLIAY